MSSKTKASKERYPACLESRTIVYTNLLLLGFEPGAMESKYNIPFTKDMFSLPNKKAFEVVMHFLFSKLNPVMAAETFRVCWPIADKKQEQVFRKSVVNWLLDIGKEDPDAHLPRIVPSLFLSPGGDKFYTVLLYFTQYVIYKAIRGENGEKERDLLRWPQLTPGVSHLSGVMVKTYQASTIRRQKRALEQTQATLLIHRQWQTFVSELVKDHRALSKAVRELEHKIKDLQAKSYDLAQARGEAMSSRRRAGVKSEGEKELLAVKRAQKLQKVRELWKVVDALVASQAPELEVVKSILQDASSNPKLDAEDMHVQVPELLLRECEAEIQRRNIANVYQGGKLSLLSLIQLWNLALQLYLEKIHQAPIASFDTIAPTVVTQVHTHHAHLTNAQALRSSLAKEIVPELKASINRLKKQTSFRRTPGRGQGSLRSFHSTTLGLGLLPATPPISFEPAHDTDITPVRLPATSGKLSHTAVDTPEAVSRLSQAVDNAALRSSGLVQGTPSSMLKDLRQQIHGKLSKLPMPSDSITSVPNRKRVKSAPSKVTSTAPELVYSRPGSMPVQSLRKQVTKVSRTRTKRNKIGLPRKKDPQNDVGTSSAPNGGRVVGTPVGRQINNNAASLTGRKTGTKATPKAHQILVDQIANAVMSGDGVEDSISPLLKPSSLQQESPPLSAVLYDPLAALDQSAFVSQDKLARTPTHTDSPAWSTAAPATRGSGTLLQQATRTLFTDTPVRAELNTPHSQQTFKSRKKKGAGLNVTTQDIHTSRQKTDISISNILDLSNTSIFPPDTVFTETFSDRGLQLHDDVVPERQRVKSRSSFSESHQIDGTDLSTTDLPFNNYKNDSQQRTVHSTHTPSDKMLEDYDFDLQKSEHTPTGLSFEELEQTLLEITRTKTPQLPFRSRQRISQQNMTSPLIEDPEEDLITSTRLSLIPPMNTSIGSSPMHQKTNHRLLNKVARTPDCKSDKVSETSISMSSRLNNVDISDSKQNGEQTKTRRTSGGSGKSVTFSDHIDKHSFHDLGSSSAGDLEETEEDYSDDADFGIIDVHSIQTDDFDAITTGSPESLQSLIISQRDCTLLGDDNTFISETYLQRSPQSKLNVESRQSPLDSALQSDLNLSGVLSPDPFKRMQLLEHISPMLTPSETPKLKHRTLSQGSPLSSLLIGQTTPMYFQHGSPLNGLNLSSANRQTPVSTENDAAIVKGLSDLNLSSSMKPDRVAEGKEPANHIPKATLEFSGLFDEDESILLSGSPLSKSTYDDGIMTRTSPPVQNLIDI